MKALRKLVLFVVVITALSIGLTACGGNDTSDKTIDTSNSDTQGTPLEGEINPNDKTDPGDLSSSADWVEISGKLAKDVVPEGVELLDIKDLQKGHEAVIAATSGTTFADVKTMFGDVKPAYFKDADQPAASGDLIEKSFVWYAKEGDVVHYVQVVFNGTDAMNDLTYSTFYSDMEPTSPTR